MQEVFILKQAKELRQEHKRMGAEKMLFLLSDVLKEHGIKYGRDKFYNLLGEHGLLIKRKGRSKRTTNSNHFYRKYPNLIREQIVKSDVAEETKETMITKTALENFNLMQAGIESITR